MRNFELLASLAKNALQTQRLSGLRWTKMDFSYTFWCMHIHIIYTIYWLTRSSRWWQNSPALWGATSFHLSLPSTTRLWSRDHLESVMYVLVWGSVHYRQVSFIQRGLLSRDKLYLGCWSCQEAWRSGQSPVHQYESAHRRATLRLYKTDTPET